MSLVHARPARGLLAVLLTLVLVGAGGAALAAATATGTVEPPPSFAFVARSDDYPDALAAGPVAGRLDAPVFLTARTSLDPNAEAGLAAFSPDVVVIAGGTAAISKDVEATIAALLPDAEIRRVAGTNRTDTARQLSELIAEFDPAHLPADAKALDADKLDGKDASAFLGANEQAADADTLDGLDASEFAAAGHAHPDLFPRTVVVPGDGTPVENGTALFDAVVSAAGATADEPWRILLDAGVYDLDARRLTIPSHVDLTGAGDDVTTIRGEYPSGADAAVYLDGTTTVRDVRIESIGGSDAIALEWSGIADVVVDGTTLFASGGTRVSMALRSGTAPGLVRDSTVIAEGDGTGSVIGVFARTSRFENVEVRTSGPSAGSYDHRAFWSSQGGDPTLVDVNVTATGDGAVGAAATHGGSMTILGGTLHGEQYGAQLLSTGSLHVQDAIVSGGNYAVIGSGTTLAGTRLDGPVGTGIICAGVYDASNTFYASACP